MNEIKRASPNAPHIKESPPEQMQFVVPEQVRQEGRHDDFFLHGIGPHVYAFNLKSNNLRVKLCFVVDVYVYHIFKL